MKENLLLLAAGFMFLIPGVICLFWPKKLYEFTHKHSGQGLEKYNPSLRYMDSPDKHYILTYYSGGVICIGIFIFILLILFGIIPTENY